MQDRRWDKEWWVRLYVQESNEAKGASVLCRAFRDHLLRYARPLDKDGNPGPDSGVLVNATTRERAINTLMAAMSAHPDEWELLRTYLNFWIDDGYLVWKKKKGRHCLCIANYVLAQTAKTPGAARTARWRARKRKTKQTQQLDLVTRDVSSDVTGDSPRDSPVTAEEEEEEEEEISSRRDTGSRHARRLRARAWLGDEDAATEAGDIGLAYEADFVVRIVRCCDEVWGHRTLLRTSHDPRVEAILTRVAEGYDPADLERAVRASAQDDFIRDNPKLQTVSTLLKSPDSVDKYLRVADSSPKGPGQGPKKRKGGAVQPKGSGGLYRESGWQDLRGRAVPAQTGTDGTSQMVLPAPPSKVCASSVTLDDDNSNSEVTDA